MEMKHKYDFSRRILPFNVYALQGNNKIKKTAKSFFIFHYINIFSEITKKEVDYLILSSTL